MSALCQSRPNATQQNPCLFDHLVGAGEQRRRHSEAEYPCRRVIDDKLELGGLHDRQVRRFRTLEDATGIDTDLTIRIRQAGSVAHQAADFGIFTRPIGGRERVARRQEDQLDTSADKRQRWKHTRAWLQRPSRCPIHADFLAK